MHDLICLIILTFKDLKNKSNKFQHYGRGTFDGKLVMVWLWRKDDDEQ